MRNPSFVTWVGWIGAIIGAVVAGCAFAFTTFQTKGEASLSNAAIVQRLDDTIQRLDRIERKLDGIE